MSVVGTVGTVGENEPTENSWSVDYDRPRTEYALHETYSVQLTFVLERGTRHRGHGCIICLL